MKVRSHIYAILAGLCCACAPAEMVSPDSSVKAVVTDEGGELRYSVSFHEQEVIAPSELGIVLDGVTIGQHASVKPVSSRVIDEEYPTRGMHSTAHCNCTEYVYDVKDTQADFQLQMRVYDDGIAFRYVFDGASPVRVNSELTTFRVPADTPVWFFERTDGDWKLKTYAGDWTKTTSEKLCSISPAGPVQGGVLVYELPGGKYMALTEAALYNYSGMRYLAREDASLQANFTEGDEGFMVEGSFSTPWRVVMLADDLNELVNSDIVSSLNPAPDSKLFADTDWIKPGRVVWSWWSNCKDYLTMPLEKHFIDAAKELGYEYTLLDEGWEKWTDKWTELKEICDYAHDRDVNVLVWKHVNGLNIPENDYSVMASFLDSIKTAGASGIKIDFMNGEAKSLIDFDIKALQQCAERKLLLDFHGCQKPSGESRTYPNELTREGIRGLELNRMNRPLSPNHNVALVFTRCILGNADYTPIGFTRPGPTTFAHQLATAFAFTSPLTVVGEHVDVLLKDERVAPMLPLIKALPTTWDETVVLPQSKIGSVALLARRSGEDWYFVALNGDKAQTVTVSTGSILKGGSWHAYAIYDNPSVPEKVDVIDIDFEGSQVAQLPLAAGGGCVAKVTRK